MERNFKEKNLFDDKYRETFLFDPWEGPAIFLVDLDAFFASVEQLDHPAWRGKPVIVGGDADKHGVVSTASYEARAYGVHSALPASVAKRLCPHAFWTRGHFDRYREISNRVMDILRDETPYVQQVSIDEAFMDVTPTSVNREHPVRIAQRIQRRVEELGVSCSVGVATSKTVAKIASDMDKPRGLTIVYPGGERDFLAPLPIRVLSGIGVKAEEKLHACNIDTLGQLAQADEEMLVRLFGKNGHVMYIRSLGQDESPVEQDDSVKSVSHETTFACDLVERADIEAAIATMAAKTGRRLRRKGLVGRTIGLRIKFANRSTHSVQRRLPDPSNDELVYTPLLYRMLDEVWHLGMPVRLVGVSVSGFNDKDSFQEKLFEEEATIAHVQNAAPLIQDKDKRRNLLTATDRVRERFGEAALCFGHELHNKDNTTGSSSKTITDYK